MKNSSVAAVVFLLSRLTPIWSLEDIKLLVLTETQAEGIPHHFSEGIKMAEEKYKSEIKFNMEVVQLMREQEQESYNHVCAVVSGGITLVVDLTWSGWEKVHDLVATAKLPIMRADVTIRAFVQALNDFLTFRNGTDSALIFENEMELDQTLYYLIEHSIIRVVVLEKLSLKNVEGLATMRPTPSFFSIFGSTQQIQEMFKIADDSDLVKRDGRWNLIFTDFKYDNFKTKTGILVNLMMMSTSVCCQLLNLNEGCTCTDDFQLVPTFLLRLGILIGDVIYEIMSEDTTLKTVKINCGSPEEHVNGTDVEFQKHLLRLLSRHESLYYDDVDNLVHYKSSKNIVVVNETEKINLGTWSTEKGFSLTQGQPMSRDRRFFRIGIVPEAVPWSYQEEDPETGTLIWKGYCIDLAYKLAEMMEFDFEFRVPKYGTYGKKLPNGKWNGLIGELASGDTDIIITDLTMTSEREEVIDFVAPYFHQSGISIMIRKPIRPTSLFKFMTVLRVEVWISILGALSVTGVMIWLLDKYSPYSARNNKEMYPYPCREFTLKESFWFALTSFTPQGGGEAPKALSGRTLVAAYWLFVVLMLATFTANLAAFLTVERMKSPVESLEQLARQSRINYTVVRKSDTHKFFVNMKKAEDTLYQSWKELALNASNSETQYRVWDYPIKEQYGHILLAIEQTGLVDNETVGIQKVLESEKGEFAFIHNEALIKYEVYRNCNLTEVGEVFAERPYAIAVQQGSMLQDEISKRILDMQRERYFETQSAKYWNSSASGDCPNTDDSEGITLSSLGGVFIATLFGLALAMITLAGEILYHKHKESVEAKFKKLKPGATKVEAVKFPNEMSDMQQKRRMILSDDFSSYGMSRYPESDYRPTGPGKMMPRVSYISVFPRHRPVFN
ncbi:hypothetical protein RUM44_004363 [Polyplax serrata]|uniref:Uncharacterized protein n=1 Tax=Polyplax serrata TaxID=468196 RepID=A0ABR1B2L8_POLSC